MIELEKKIGDKTEIVYVAEGWSEVYYQSYINMIKGEVLQIEDDLERSLKVISSVSSNPEACEIWLREMGVDTFRELMDSMEFVDFKDLPMSNKKFLNIGNKKYAIKSDFNDVKWGNMISFEKLKAEFKDTEDYVLALGVLLAEVDAEGNEKLFSLKEFDYIVNNLPDQVLMVDIFQHVNFFLNGAKKQSLTTLPIYTVRKVKK